jgi:hypothetical protein
MGAPPHCSSPRLDHVLPRRGYSQRLVCLLHQCAMSSRHCSDPLHLHCRVLVVWWCPVRQSLNLLAFYPLNMKCIDDRNCHIIHEPAMRKRRKVQVEIMKEKKRKQSAEKKVCSFDVSTRKHVSIGRVVAVFIVMSAREYYESYKLN